MRNKLSVLSLGLLTIGSVDSIRNLPAAALAGNYLLHYFILALFLFLLPCALISGWFSQQSHQGVYSWVKSGLGRQPAFMAAWFQCLQNVLLYPTLLSFIAGVILYLVAPELTENKSLIFFIIVGITIGLTQINLRGIQLSNRVNTFCTITGLIVPFILILIIGVYWYCSHDFSEISPPANQNSYSWSSLTAIMLSFCGVDLAAVHAKESQAKAYQHSLIFSVSLIFCSMLFGSMIFAMIIPPAQLNFITSIPQLIHVFFNTIHASIIAPFINGLIVLGCIGAANNWLIGPIKSLGFAAEEGFLGGKYRQLNNQNVPSTLLLIQALFIITISALFLIVPSINTSYWIMLNTATQIYLLMYLLLFISAIKVAIKKKGTLRLVIIMASMLGLIGINIALVVSFALPPTLQIGSQKLYSIYSGLFLFFMIMLPFLPKLFTYKRALTN
ncbi:APC family permease [Legionella sp. km772]|uniref:APC family permease n=1 Tax=Legionella sp. km772 TaxID=2498111 RepID=UPI000F8F2B1D|nr:APC family permease [Legionella sp. km772]RUR12493.1 APC family permease [Legionella sp. km772]